MTNDKMAMPENNSLANHCNELRSEDIFDIYIYIYIYIYFFFFLVRKIINNGSY